MALVNACCMFLYNHTMLQTNFYLSHTYTCKFSLSKTNVSWPSLFPSISLSLSHTHAYIILSEQDQWPISSSLLSFTHSHTHKCIMIAQWLSGCHQYTNNQVSWVHLMLGTLFLVHETPVYRTGCFATIQPFLLTHKNHCCPPPSHFFMTIPTAHKTRILNIPLNTIPQNTNYINHKITHSKATK